ncbi:MAG TPA: DHH family phosphoesterase [Solirubrobacteraceae bacterium]|nr:DHH family phosphoesterase [Solirubrobacteraceae bacterium]
MSATTAGTREQVLDAVRSNDRFLLVTHENPDGDALGSLVAMHGVLRLLEKESVMFIGADEFPLPYEYRFFDLEPGVVTAVPDDVATRVVIFLDCGNIDRAPEALRDPHLRILNVDHHHDNTRFGTVDHVVPEASCTAEIVWDLMRSLGVEATPEIADALYVGLVTDTGKFMYENTGTRAHVMAAELIDAGVDVHAIYRRLYEGIPHAKLRLLALALGAVRRFDDGRLTLSRITREHFAQAEAEDSYSEGIVDHLRAVAGTKVAALVRELNGDGPSRAKVSLRAADPAVDVSAIARAGGGGGHRQAAGFTTQLPDEQLVDFLRDALAAQLAALPHDHSSR